MTLVNAITRSIDGFMVARLYGARSFTSWTEDAMARARSEDGGIGMQAAIISGGLVIVAIAIAAIIAGRGQEAANVLDSANLATTVAAPTTAA